MEKEIEQKLAQLQLIEQSLQTILLQKQQFQSQLIENESAIKELEKAESAYKIIGNIMVAAKKEELQKELKDRLEALKLRINSIEKQEKHIKEKAQAIRKEVMGKLKK